MTRRIPELDYLKGILILLVISFHLVYFEQLHPCAKQVVYAFHMPAFLLLSGYLMNIGKTPKQFLRTMLWLFIPYIIMESGYVLMASLLPINEHIDHLTLCVFLDRLLLHPLGPYWYLHTLIICGAIYYLVFRYLQRGLLTRLAVLGLAYFVLTLLPLKGVEGSFYFLAGAAIRQSGTDFRSAFRPSWLSVVAFALLAALSESPTQGSVTGILITWTAISSLLRTAPSPTLFHDEAGETRRKGGLLLIERAWRGACFLGRNSLVLYVFSPIFTILCKQLVPFLRFDPTGLLFLLASLAVCVSGCLAIAWAMDFTGTSRFFFGRKAIQG